MRVLVVEDDPEYAELLATRFRSVAQVDIVHTIAEAMKCIKCGFDVITLDLALPDSTTEETIKRIGEIKMSSQALLIVVTGSTKKFESIADGFIHKQEIANSEEFWKKIKELAEPLMFRPEYRTHKSAIENLINRLAEDIKK